MKNLTQLIQEIRNKKSQFAEHEDGKGEWVCIPSDVFRQWDRQEELLTAIVRNEIERKKGLFKEAKTVREFMATSGTGVGYNTAITEDIQYWQNVLEEIEKNV